jgi:amiloride-sensitive sodium channel
MFRSDLSDLNITFPFPSVDWTPEEGYPSNMEHESLPWKPVGAGKHLGLTIVVDCEIGEYFCSSTASIGFKVIISIQSKLIDIKIISILLSYSKNKLFQIQVKKAP